MARQAAGRAPLRAAAIGSKMTSPAGAAKARVRSFPCSQRTKSVISNFRGRQPSRGTEALRSSHYRGIPPSESEFAHVVEWRDAALAAGRTVIVHCRQGIGLSEMAAACVLVLNGVEPAADIARVSSARGLPVP